MLCSMYVLFNNSSGAYVTVQQYYTCRWYTICIQTSYVFKGGGGVLNGSDIYFQTVKKEGFVRHAITVS